LLKARYAVVTAATVIVLAVLAFLSYGLSFSFAGAILSSIILTTSPYLRFVPKHSAINVLAIGLLCGGLLVDSLIYAPAYPVWVVYVVCAALSLNVIFAIILTWMVVFALFLLSASLTLAEMLGLMATSTLSMYGAHQVRTLQKALHKQSGLDVVFGCFNAQAFKKDAEHAWHLGQRYHLVTSMVVLDLDEDLDIEGYQECARRLVEVWTSRLRNTDTLYKVSDRRFVCLLSSTTQQGALVLADDLRKATHAYESPLLHCITLATTVCSSEQVSSLDTWLTMAYHHGLATTTEKS